jgi:membrane associated rhomboid family serine protease
VIPLRDVIPGRTTPWVTFALIGANLIVFLYELQGQGSSALAGPRLLDDYTVLPAAFTWSGAFTGLFAHANWLHLGANLLALWIFGDNVEDRMGHVRFALFFVMTGLAGSLAEVVARPAAAMPLVGASGAIAGLMGAYLLLFPSSRILVLIPLIVFTDIIEVPATFLMLIWLAVQVLAGAGQAEAGIADGLALWGYAGGLVSGMAGVRLFRRRDRLKVEWWSAT